MRNAGVSEILLAEKPRVSFERVIPWRPVKTQDAGHVWLMPVWATSVDGLRVMYTRRILPIGRAVEGF